MKQLKFMLAAATAVGIAAAAQAADQTNELANDTFDNDSELSAAYAYIPASDNDNDNESAIVEGGYNSSAKALKVNTGTNPLLRSLDWSGTAARPVDMTEDGFKSLYIDTMVQFTVTPDGDTVSAGDDDKLMIYLKEVPEVKNENGEVTAAATTKLMVKAAKIVTTAAGGIGGGVKTTYEPTEVAVDNYTAAPNTWYQMKVESSLNAAGCVVFTIKLKNPLVDSDFITLTNAEALDPNNSALFPSRLGAESKTLTYVGFAGEGMVDDLTVATVTEQTSVDFTFTFSWGDGISAVTYTIGDGEETSVENGTAIEDLAAGTVININVTPADWYALVANPTLSYTVATDNTSANLDSLVTKLAEVTKDPVTGAEKIVVTETTTPAQVGVLAGSFKDEPAGSAELNKALTWATSKAGATAANAGAKVGELDFSNTEETPAEQAYLLNCAPTAEALQEAKDKFKFDAFDPLNPPAAADFNAKGYNGTVEIHGATTLENGGDWAKDKQGAFYKAVLTIAK